MWYDQWFNLAWSLSCTSGERVVGWLVWDKGDHLSYRHHHKVGGGTSSSLHSHHRHHHTHMFVRHSWEQAMHLVVVLYSKMSLRKTNYRCRLDVSNAPTITATGSPSFKINFFGRFLLRLSGIKCSWGQIFPTIWLGNTWSWLVCNKQLKNPKMVIHSAQ